MEVRRPRFLCWFCRSLAQIPEATWLTMLDVSCEMRWRDQKVVFKFLVYSSFLLPGNAKSVLKLNTLDTFLAIDGRNNLKHP